MLSNQMALNTLTVLNGPDWLRDGISIAKFELGLLAELSQA